MNNKVLYGALALFTAISLFFLVNDEPGSGMIYPVVFFPFIALCNFAYERFVKTK